MSVVPVDCAALQVCVAALCIKQKDLLHAGYLAITLLFFRQRTSLVTAPAAPAGVLAKGARLFLWLPAFNLLVMGLTLLYQVGLVSQFAVLWASLRGLVPRQGACFTLSFAQCCTLTQPHPAALLLKRCQSVCKHLRSLTVERL